MKNSNKIKGVTILPLIMLITGSIDSIRNFPATALFGQDLVFFLLFAAVVFLIPTALIAAQLSAAIPNKGGIYEWVKMAFGQKLAVLAIWLQWINTMVWFPTMLSFIAATLAYMFMPSLATNPIYLVSAILVIFWALTFANLKGVNTSAKLASVCAIVGLLIPLGVFIVLGISWVVSGQPMNLDLSVLSSIPDFTHVQNWSSLTAIMAAFLGIELAAVHIRDVENAQKTFPKALLISVLLIILTMLLGSLAIAIVLPHDKISLVDGVMQAFTLFFQAYHLMWILPLMTILLLVGSIGSMINWLISPAKGLLEAAQDGYLPPFFTRVNAAGVPNRLLIIQAIIVSAICTVILMIPSVNSSYWLLTDISTQLYMCMYILMFTAALKIRNKLDYASSAFNLPGKQFGLFTVCALGLIGCTISIVVGFIAPDGVSVSQTHYYSTVFGIGLIVMILPVLALYRHKITNQ